MFDIVEVLDFNKGHKNSAWEDQGVKILSEESVGFEKPVILVEEWKDSTSSGEIENGKPK